ncbi:fasciclin domain-containing protein [Chitinophaga horti]|uniref:Fasciclin domain-containing protein n=1 Tax=Chitinophaga horti TaxID=2920382 RepID=A0ABY6J626_9BACT|nr:fasciclin domain-containing protein [Chitinophaga horti]UYQ94042.1 fasciclin domain-containing protein [Chitinophaga horti]
MRINIYKILLAIALGATAVTGCEKWDEHNALNDASLSNTLLAQIQSEASLSKFAELLAKSGYDKVLSSSKTFTVFAPTNDALANLDAGIVSDTAKLNRFIENHIALQSQYSAQATTQHRIAFLNGKYANFQGKTIEQATITAADKQVKNGVLQIIDKPLPVLANAWQTLENNAAIPAKQKAYLLSLFRNVFDATNAEQIGIDPNTGMPVYKPGTDSIRSNLFWQNVYDLRDESKNFSLFVLEDAAWDAEVAKFLPYTTGSTADSTALFAQWTVVKDLARDTLYRDADLPDTLLSKFNVKVPVSKLTIKQTIKTSNGNVYIMTKAEVKPSEKFKQYRVEGENWRFITAEKRGNMYVRDRINTLTGLPFRDVVANGHGTAQFSLGYVINNVPSMKFKAYWVAANDNIITVNFTQKVSIGEPTTMLLPYVTVTPNTYSEVYLGEFTMSQYQPSFTIYLTAANSTAANANLLVCDYIRLEPVF